MTQDPTTETTTEPPRRNESRRQPGRRAATPPPLPFPATEAACYDSPDLMFPDIANPWGNPLRKPRKGRRRGPPAAYQTAVDLAAAICAECFHIKACDTYAREAGPNVLPIGIYGGRDPIERRKIHEAAKHQT